MNTETDSQLFISSIASEHVNGLRKKLHYSCALAKPHRSVPAVTARMRSYLALSQGVLPPDTRWYCKPQTGDVFDVYRQPEKLEHFIADSAFPDDEGIPMPNMGYSFTVLGLRDDPRHEKVGPWFSVGVGGNQPNHFSFSTDQFVEDDTDPRLVSYSVMRTNMLAVARAFEPDWCEASPLRLGDYFDIGVYNRPPMGLAWMIWFCPTLAALVEPPVYTNTIIERLTDGSLFMATSEEVFDCANTLHLEQARAIHRQIDPLNYTVPFCGRSGRSDRVPPFPQL